MKERSVHVTYDEEDHESRDAIRQGIGRLTERALALSGSDRESFRILDAGCGLGLMLRDLREKGFGELIGMDFDSACTTSASRFAPTVQADLSRLDHVVEAESFDLVVLSHVLEHMRDPIATLERIARVTRRWLILAVPNPLRPQIILKYDIRGRDYSNQGHVFSWDRSHFSNFVENHTEFSVREWAVDQVRLVPTRGIRKVLARTGALDLIERRWAAGRWPYFSTSLMVLCEKETAGSGRRLISTNLP